MQLPNFNSTRQLFFCFVIALFCFGREAAQNTPPLLTLNVPVEGSSAAGAAQTYRLHLEPNQFIVLVLEQKGSDMKLALDEASGAQLFEINQNGQIFGNERLLFQSENAARELLVRVFPAEKDAAGKFSLILAQLKTADARDQLRLSAQAAILDGQKLAAEAKAESKEQARADYQKALELARQGGDAPLEAEILILLQDAALDGGDKQKSVEFGRAALALPAVQASSYDPARVKTLMGKALVNMGEMKQGIEILMGSLSEARKFGDHSMEISSLLDISLGYQRLGDAAKCLEYAEQANQAAKNINDQDYQSESLKLISRVYYDRGDFTKSIEILNQALGVLQNSNENAKYIIYNDLATNFIFLGQLQKALDYLQQSVVYYREVSGNKWNQAATLQSISQVYSTLGQNARALEYSRQAAEIYSRFGYRDAVIGIARTKGSIYRGLKDFEKERDSYLEALKLAEQSGDKNMTAGIYSSLGSAEKRLGHPDAALGYFLKTAQLRGESKSKAFQSAALIYVSDMYIILGQPAKASASAGQALEIARTTGDPITQSNALYNLARTKHSQNDLAGALQLIEASLKIIESLRAEIINPENRTAYFSTVRDKYDFYIQVLLELQNEPGNKEYGARAFAASERARARSLLDLLAESFTNVSAGISPELKARERGDEAQLSALQSQLIRAKSAEKPDTARIANLQKDIAQADNLREQLESEIRRTNPRYAGLKYPTTIDLAQTQAMLDERTVLLEYQIGAGGSFLFAIGKNEFQTVRLPNDAALRQSIDMLRRSITQPTRAGLASYLIAGRELYGTLLAPIEPLLKTKNRIIIAADGALNYVPFEVLLRNNQEASLDKLPYLVRDFEISYTPSASVLANLKSGAGIITAPVAKPAKSFLAFAAPDYEMKTADGNQIVSQNTRAVLGGNGAWKLTNLKNAGLEAERIARLFPAGQATVFTGAEATEERAKSNELLSQYRYLHFAVHGLIDEDQPQFSSLVLSLPKSEAVIRDTQFVIRDSQSLSRDSSSAAGNSTPAVNTANSALRTPPPAPTEDGLLQTTEIFNLRLQADLVTLSACETGLGQELRGEGIVGLTRAFFYAGTPSVLVSLWKVDDASTADLMTLFYEQLRKDNGRNKAAALRQAQLKLISENRYAHPYYWAPFILQGKSSSQEGNK